MSEWSRWYGQEPSGALLGAKYKRIYFSALSAATSKLADDRPTFTWAVTWAVIHARSNTASTASCSDCALSRVPQLFPQWTKCPQRSFLCFEVRFILDLMHLDTTDHAVDGVIANAPMTKLSKVSAISGDTSTART